MKSYNLEKKLQKSNLKDMLKFLGSNSYSTIEELPFWGFKSDAGIYQNIFNYWVEKAFCKSKQQMVSYKKIKNVHIEGALAADILHFQDIMLEMSEKLNNYIDFYKLKYKKYPTDYKNLNIDQIFYQYYESSQVSIYLNETGKKFWNHFNFYDTLIDDALNQDEMNITQKYSEIKSYFSLIHSVNIDRFGSFSKPIKTLMIFYKLEEKEKSKQSINKSKLKKQTQNRNKSQSDNSQIYPANIENSILLLQQQQNNITQNSIYINDNQSNLYTNNNQNNNNSNNILLTNENDQSILYSPSQILNVQKNINLVKLYDDCNTIQKLEKINCENKGIIQTYQDYVAPQIKQKDVNIKIFNRNSVHPLQQDLSQYQPLLWVQFNNLKQKDLKINIPEDLKVCANKILIKIIDHHQDTLEFIDQTDDQTYQEPINGPGFSSITFEGELINIKHLNNNLKKTPKNMQVKSSNSQKQRKSTKY